MKTRKKTVKEKQYDLSQINVARLEVCNAAETFMETFNECDGKVWYDEAARLNSKLWDLQHNQRISKMKLVGDTWDYDEDITGEYRYHGI
tara:strand:+ start:693 stop:962 length:270 start_codon:yes stop_codon:yes gene_type:complete